MANTDYTWIRMKGDDSRSLYTWFKFSRYETGTAPDGTVEISDSPHDKLYMGIAENKKSKNPSNNPSDYRWVKVGSDSVVVDKFTWFRFADDDKGTNISGDAENKAYIGVSENRLTRTPSDDPNDYRWVKVGGDVNITGTTLYTWIRYSQYHDGRAMTDTPNTDTKFMGIATNKMDATPSAKPMDYQWMRIRDDKGVLVSTDLTAVDRKSYVHYAYSRFAGGYDAATGGPSFEQNVDAANYIGIVVNYPDPTPPTDPALYVWMGKPVAGRAGPQGIPGERGRVGPTGPSGPPKYTWIKWSQYADGKATTGASILSDDPRDKNYMGIAHNKDVEQPSDEADDYTWVRISGKDGKAGASPKPLYHHVMFSDYDNGVDPQGNDSITDNPNGKAYLGFAMNNPNRTASSNPRDYRWVKILGNTGAKGDKGDKGDRGEHGLQGGIGLRGLAGRDGKDGKDGTSVFVAGTVDKVSELTTITGKVKKGQAYYVTEIMRTYIFNGGDQKDAKNWGDLGVLVGCKGDSVYTHVKFSEFENGVDASGNTSFTDDRSKIYYMGVVNNYLSSTPPTEAKEYIWSRLYGERANFTHIVFSEHKGGINPDTNQPDFTADYPDRAKYVGILNNTPDPQKPTDPSKYVWAYFRGMKGDTPTHVDPLYTWVKWSSFPQGRDPSNKQSDLHDTAEDRHYMGVAINQTSKTPSFSPDDYTWMRIRGKDGEDGDNVSTHIMYSRFSNGIDPTTKQPSFSEDNTLKYMGIMMHSAKTPSTQATDYVWFTATAGYTWIAYGNNPNQQSSVPLYDKEANHTHMFLAFNMKTKQQSLNYHDYSICVPVASGIKFLKPDFFFELANNLNSRADIPSTAIFIDRSKELGLSTPVFIKNKIVLHGPVRRLSPAIDRSTLKAEGCIVYDKQLNEAAYLDVISKNNAIFATKERMYALENCPSNKLVIFEGIEINPATMQITKTSIRDYTTVTFSLLDQLHKADTSPVTIKYKLKYHYRNRILDHYNHVNKIVSPLINMYKNDMSRYSPLPKLGFDKKLLETNGRFVSVHHVNNFQGCYYDFYPYSNKDTMVSNAFFCFGTGAVQGSIQRAAHKQPHNQARDGNLTINLDEGYVETEHTVTFCVNHYNGNMTVYGIGINPYVKFRIAIQPHLVNNYITKFVDTDVPLSRNSIDFPNPYLSKQSRRVDTAKSRITMLEFELLEVYQGGFADNSIPENTAKGSHNCLLSDIVISENKSFELSFDATLGHGTYPILTSVPENSTATKNTDIATLSHGIVTNIPAHAVYGFRIYKITSGTLKKSTLVVEIANNCLEFRRTYNITPSDFISVKYDLPAEIGHGENDYFISVKYDSINRKIIAYCNGNPFTPVPGCDGKPKNGDFKYNLMFSTDAGGTVMSYSSKNFQYADYFSDDQYMNTSSKFSVSNFKFRHLS